MVGVTSSPVSTTSAVPWVRSSQYSRSFSRRSLPLTGSRKYASAAPAPATNNVLVKPIEPIMGGLAPESGGGMGHGYAGRNVTSNAPAPPPARQARRMAAWSPTAASGIRTAGTLARNGRSSSGYGSSRHTPPGSRATPSRTTSGSAARVAGTGGYSPDQPAKP